MLHKLKKKSFLKMTCKTFHDLAHVDFFTSYHSQLIQQLVFLFHTFYSSSKVFLISIFWLMLSFSCSFNRYILSM